MYMLVRRCSLQNDPEQSHRWDVPAITGREAQVITAYQEPG
jgi:hypothetical protein